MEIEGGCYCGAVRYKVQGDPLFKGQCHCRECQYISGGSPNLVMGMQEAGFAYTKGRYIMNLDPDNMIPPTALKILSDALDKG